MTQPHSNVKELSSISGERLIPARDPEPALGEKMSDGTVFAGNSPDTGKPMYATLIDAPLAMTFNGAADYAATLEIHGHRDWRVPTRNELNLLFNNRAAIGGFDSRGSYLTAGWHWSSSQHDNEGAWAQQFNDRDGLQGHTLKNGYSSVRCVR